MYKRQQLYQIRGRVGRSTQQAYAFLIIPKNLKLTHKSRSRLKAIEEYTQVFLQTYKLTGNAKHSKFNALKIALNERDTELMGIPI